ncbi:MAG TPA: phosphoribosylformylglycinamidine synthase subunit PurQ [Acidimicrobiales bacterium]|nr:phosphoribosylformylglycinamidine synthase subunit PurQ [Acidimicrobiales bacterium]
MTRVAVVVFPGSNCEHDVAAALAAVGVEPVLVWHGEASLGDVDGAVLPGGFAHGDYLRPGAIARFSPVMAAVSQMAAEGAPVIGICNGFQVLTEAGLLPGALRRNEGLRFLCEPVSCRVRSARSVLTSTCEPDQVLELPINHYEGNYTCDEATLRLLVENDQIVLTYEDNPNGSIADIAGVSNEAGNVVGLMPHPERAISPLLGSTDGLPLIESIAKSASAWAGRARRPAAPVAN